MKKTKTQKGITLVALIITIIVLLILAVVAIRAVQGDGILGKAKEGATKYEESKQKENDVLSGYELTLAQASGKAWKQSEDGKKVTKGNVTLNVGDVVGTDITVTGTLPTLETGNSWAVLGEEKGKLLLVTTKNITKNGTVQKATLDGNNDYYKKETLTLANGTTTETTVIDINKVTPVLDAVISSCGITKNGTVADSIRSINVDDINRVTTYDPENIGLDHNGGKYAAGASNEYGNIVTYEAGQAIVATNRATGTTGSTCKLPKGTSNSVFTVKSNDYDYYPETLTTSSDTSSELINTKWYKLLFSNENSDDAHYWLASPFVGGGSFMAVWGVRRVYYSKVGINDLWYSAYGLNTQNIGMRAVVSLPSDVQVQ